MESIQQRVQHLVEQASAALAAHGLSARLEVSAGEDTCLVEVDLPGGDGFQALVSTSSGGWVGVLDPHQEDLTTAQWPRYVVARAQGATAGEALEEATLSPGKARWWRRTRS
ncbi:hypothetical protein ACFY4K_31460 [Streptomyces leeuwenhoekii]|jgi:hypothetical protein|uniref:hypothetical protein n=1 Tax=Streptomyces leeuwenhoekii TaxID=1437453 RepID=UPI0036A79669